jgi:hypothetical protein
VERRLDTEETPKYESRQMELKDTPFDAVLHAESEYAIY